MNAAEKNYDSYVASDEYADIKDDLLRQLKANGTEEKYYLDQVNTYMSFWVEVQLLTCDIQKRGVNVAYNNGGGQKGKKINDSLDRKTKVNAQMLKLLSEIGIKPTSKGGEDIGL